MSRKSIIHEWTYACIEAKSIELDDLTHFIESALNLKLDEVSSKVVVPTYMANRSNFLKEYLENVVSWMSFALFSLCEWCKEQSNHQWKSLFDFSILLSWWMVFGCVILFIWFDCMNWFIFSDLHVWFTIFGMNTENGRKEGVKWMDIGRCRIKWLPLGSLTYSFCGSKGVKQMDIGRCRRNDFLCGPWLILFCCM